MTRVLGEILRSKRAEVERLVSRPSPCFVPAGPRPIATAALRRAEGDPLRLIAEIKYKSPSAGPLSAVLRPGRRALAYAGAAMISVLCDGPFFDGSYDHLLEVRSVLDEARRAVPVLAKEIVLDAAQIHHARAHGADAILLVARIVSPEELSALVDVARLTGVEPLVEVVTDEELEAALATRATLIGVNARDLDTLAIDPDRAARLVARIPEDRIPVHLSGLRTPDDVRRIAGTSAHAALVGEALMREDDPRSLLSLMLSAANG